MEKKGIDGLSEQDIDRVIEMAWEDRTPFDAIEQQFGITEKEVISLMRNHLHERNWKKWRSRVQGRKTKHRVLNAESRRFRSAAQRSISGNRISKR